VRAFSFLPVHTHAARAAAARGACRCSDSATVQAPSGEQSAGNERLGYALPLCVGRPHPCAQLRRHVGRRQLRSLVCPTALCRRRQRPLTGRLPIPQHGWPGGWRVRQHPRHHTEHQFYPDWLCQRGRGGGGGSGGIIESVDMTFPYPPCVTSDGPIPESARL